MNRTEFEHFGFRHEFGSWVRENDDLVVGRDEAGWVAFRRGKPGPVTPWGSPKVIGAGATAEVAIGRLVLQELGVRP